MQERKKGAVVKVDGVEIPIDECVEVNGKFLGNAVDATAFCNCFIPKFYYDLKGDKEEQRKFINGDWSSVGKADKDSVAQFYKTCIGLTTTGDSTARFSLTPNMAEKLRQKMKAELAGTDLEKTIDVDKYCDCIITSFQNDFTVNEIMDEAFQDSEEYKQVIDKCQASSEKKLPAKKL